MSLSQLESSISKKLDSVYVVMGDAAVLRDGAVDLLVKKGLERAGLAAFNHSSYRASEPNGAEAFATARTLPMMADIRVVVVRDLDEGKKDFFEALCNYIPEQSPSTLLVLTGSRFPKVEKGGRNWQAKVKNAIKKHGGNLVM